MNNNDVNSGKALNEVIQEAQSILGADTLVLYYYNEARGEWANKPIIIDPTEASTINKKAVAKGANTALESSKPLFLEPQQLDKELSSPFIKRENIKSSVAMPLSYEGQKLGVLFINYRSFQKFTPEFQDEIASIAQKVAGAVYNYLLTQLSIELIDSDTLRIQMLLPKAITISQFFEISQKNVSAIEQIYLTYAVIYSGSRKAVNQLLKTIDRKTLKNKNVTLSEIRRIAARKEVNIDAPLLTSIKYGSPGSFDLLGIGKILEILHDTIKDAKWRGKHEQEYAELERESKKLEMERVRIENEKTMIEIASAKINLLEQISNLELSKDQRKIIASALLPQLTSLYDLNPSYLLSSGEKAQKKRKSE